MVYRGKPSAGCDNCRKAKKRCTLEQPSCMRCVKLKKPCLGYRDTTELQVEDESESVRRKAQKGQQQRQVVKKDASDTPGTQLQSWPSRNESTVQVRPRSVDHGSRSVSTDATCNDDGLVDLFTNNPGLYIEPGSHVAIDHITSMELAPWGGSFMFGVPMTITADELAVSYFSSQLTSEHHWGILSMQAMQGLLSPCLDLAMRACGMAALANVERVPRGHHYARMLYIDALSRVNAALRDPVQSKTDDSLVAVSMLGFYENLTCDSRESITSWKAHMEGATQLLRLRGKDQFKTTMGRVLFRQTRGQILTHCIWDDLQPPTFLMDWDPELRRQTELSQDKAGLPSDVLLSAAYAFATLRSRIREATISDVEAVVEASKIEARMIQWSVHTRADSPRLSYHTIDVSDSPHIWQGKVHSYVGAPAPMIWNTWRVMRILITRTQEQLSRRLTLTPTERHEQALYHREIRRQMADEICFTCPATLGHAAPAWSCPSVVVSAYGSIWPLFFAATSAMERTMLDAQNAAANGLADVQPPSIAAAQLAWIFGRLEFISKDVGLRWASGIAATLKGDLSVHGETIWGDVTSVRQPKFMAPIYAARRAGSKAAKDTALDDADVQEASLPAWLGKILGEETTAA